MAGAPPLINCCVGSPARPGMYVSVSMISLMQYCRKPYWHQLSRPLRERGFHSYGRCTTLIALMANPSREVSYPFRQYLICSSKASHTGRIRQPGTGRTRAIFELATHIEYVRTAICRELVIAGVMRLEKETSDQTPSHNTKGSMPSTGIPK